MNKLQTSFLRHLLPIIAAYVPQITDTLSAQASVAVAAAIAYAWSYLEKKVS